MLTTSGFALRQAAPPWLVLHGGPGSGASASLLRAFELSRTPALAPHQPGCGSRHWPRSRPMTLKHLLADLESLRLKLGLARWPVCGGSWGGYLALAYAMQHPDCVESLMLRAPFVGGSADLWRFVSQLSPRAIKAIGMPRLHQRAHLSAWLRSAKQVLQFGTPVSRCSKSAGLTRLWLHAEACLAAQSARRASLHLSVDSPLWVSQRTLSGRLQKQTRRSLARQHTRHLPSRSERNKVRIQAMLLPAALKNPLARLRNKAVANCDPGALPVQLLHGLHDRICQPGNTRRIAQLFASSQVHWLPAGHLGVEPAIEQTMRRLLQDKGSA